MRCPKCGGQFPENRLDGSRRLACPYCSASLPGTATPVQSQEDSTGHTQEVIEASPAPPSKEFTRPTTRATPLTVPVPQRQASLACPTGQRCNVATCASAFKCNAIRHPQLVPGYVLKWTLIVGAIAFAGCNAFMLGLPIVLRASGQVVHELPFIVNLIAMLIVPSIVTFLTWLICTLTQREARQQARIAANVAERLNWQFTHFESVSPQQAVNKHPFVVPGRVASVWRMMNGPVAGRQWEVQHFEILMRERDLVYSNVEQMRLLAQKVARQKEVEVSCPITLVVCNAAVALPNFYLTPYQGMHFFIQQHDPNAHIAIGHEDWPYVLLGSDVRSLQMMFADPVKSYFRKHDRWNIQCLGGKLTAWRLNDAPGPRWHSASTFPSSQPRNSNELFEVVNECASILEMLEAQKARPR